jgi:hypothetical protein
VVNVIAFPPVGRLSHEWSEEAPLAASRSVLTGARFVSASQRKRRLCSVTVSSLGRGGAGAGYMEVLKRLLAGGEHLVRLESLPIPNALVQATLTGTGTAGTAAGWPILTVTGLPASTRVARPGMFVSIGGDVAMIVADASSDGAGVAVLRLLTALSGSGAAVINARDSGVFEALSLPRAAQPVSGDWTWAWSFREVFENETDGFVEVDPWSP